MRILLIILFLFLIAIVETSLFLPLNLMLVIILIWAMTKETKKVLVWALVGGLFLDLLSGLVFGRIILSLVICAYLVNLIAEKVFKEANLWTKTTLAFTTSLVYNLVVNSSFSVFSIYLAWPEAIFNTILVLIFFRWISLVKV